MNENKPSLLKRLIHRWNEQRGMTAMANVMSGRKSKWYERPLDWVAPFVMGLIVAFTVCWEGLRYFGLPLLVVCMFFTLHRMNNQLDRIEAAVTEPETDDRNWKWIGELIEENENE